MSIVLRVDVDNAYPRDWWHSPFEILRTKLNLGYWFKWFGYLENLEKLVGYLGENNVKANFYFRLSTLPDGELVQRIIRGGHEVGLHAVQTHDYDSFLSELKSVEEHFGQKVIGFTKHGLKRKLSRNHEKEYDEEKYLKYAEKAGLDYFLGSKRTSEMEVVSRNGIAFVASPFSLKDDFQQCSLDSFLSKSRERDVLVVCHPVNIYREESVREKLEYIVENGSDFKTMREVVDVRHSSG